MPYQTAANQIIKDSIKSAIFIDENALSYGKVAEPGVYEESLSLELYENFKQNGISLTIQKFHVGNEKDEALKSYFFKARDLVLLDWKLNGEDGEEYSLKLLSDVVMSEHIHFCVIYTSDPKIENIYANILSYFSGRTFDDYERIKEQFDAYEDALNPLFERFNLFNNNANRPLIREIIELGEEFNADLNTISKNKCEAFKHLKIAFSLYHKSPNPISYSIGSFENKTLLVNNTVITIVNKDGEDSHKDAASFIKQFSSNIINSDFSFTQLLGLELRHKLIGTGAFIDPEFLNVKKETLAFHRAQILEENNSDLSFIELLKNVYLEQARLKLGTSELRILNDSIFEHIGTNGKPKVSELAAMNVYYNSLKLSTENKKLDFGDVFIDKNNTYYLCITALCDCLRPKKTDYIFFFAKGTNINIDKAILLGDSAFVSFISKDKAVVWSNIDTIQETEKEAMLKELDSFRYKPIYVKPISYLVESPNISDNKIRVDRIYKYENTPGDIDFIELEYVTTIKHNYTQRIANHAFTHPVRIGVDFVKNTN